MNKIYFGKHFYANTGLTIPDENAVIFGDDVFLGPHVSIYTAGHPLSAEVRNLELEYARAVKKMLDGNYYNGYNKYYNNMGRRYL